MHFLLLFWHKNFPYLKKKKKKDVKTALAWDYPKGFPQASKWTWQLTQAECAKRGGFPAEGTGHVRGL